MSGHGTDVGAVYVHAPFCARRCGYCDFAVTVRRTGDADAWARALARELDAVRAEGLFALAPALGSLYVGGGTPSLLGPAAMRALVEVLGRERLRAAELEWTAEANPESFTAEVARGWAAQGLNRLSLGVQTFHEPTLRWMGRLHGAEGARRAVEVARAAGIDNLSVDLIFGLPSGLGRPWREDLVRVLDLDVPHVSLYGLTVEPGTPLGRAVADGREPSVDEEQYREEFLLAAELLTGAGYDHYEVSNFARPGAESRHNLVYWRGGAYLGLGNSAHSYAHPLRRWNVRGWDDYQARLAAGGTAEAERETLDEGATALERVWLGLRTSTGYPLEAAGATARSLVEVWTRGGLALVDKRRVRLTPRGWLLLDRLAVELDDALTHEPSAPMPVGSPRGAA